MKALARREFLEKSLKTRGRVWHRHFRLHRSKIRSRRSGDARNRRCVRGGRHAAHQW